MFKSKYNQRLLRYSAIAAVGVVICGLAIGFISREGILGDNSLVKFPIFLALFAGAFALSIPWWRSLDDVQKQGQLSSWYWGSTAGGGIFLVWLIANNTHHTEFSQGAFYMFLAQAGLALFCYAFWKFRGRGAAE